MTSARTRRRASLLFASFLAVVSLGSGPAQSQAVRVVPSPDLGMTLAPVPVQVQIYLWEPRAAAPARAPQSLVCPRHTKWRVDCTPVQQR